MATIYVPQDVLTINEAVQNANPGDTIKVSSGIYNENISVNKDKLIIEGDPEDKPQIIGNEENSFKPGLKLLSNRITLSNLDVSGMFICGVMVCGESATIIDCIISNLSGIGIHVDNTSCDNLISSCACDCNSKTGLIIDGENTSVLVSSFSNNGENGILCNSGRNTITMNDVTFNSFSGVRIIKDYNTIIDNTISHNNLDGITLFSNKNYILSNIISHNNGSGILSSGSRNSYITNNISQNSFCGIDLGSGAKNKTLKNIISYNGTNGILLGDDSKDNLVDNNVLEKNYNAEISLSESSIFNVIRYNSMQVRTTMFELPSADNNTNTITGN